MRGKGLKRQELSELGSAEPFQPCPEEKQENAKENEPERRDELAEGAMVLVILVAVLMKRVDQGMEGQRGKSDQ